MCAQHGRIQLIIKITIFLSSFLLFALCQSANSSKVALPDIPLPIGAKWQWVARDMIINGSPMSIKAFVYNDNDKKFIKFYDEFCRKHGARHFSNDGSDKSRVIGCQLSDGNYYLSIIIEPAAKKRNIHNLQIEGKITVSLALGKAKVNTFSQFPVLVGSKIISKIESSDGDRLVQTIVFENNNSVRANIKYLNRELAKVGFSPEFTNDVLSNTENAQVNFEKAGELVQVTVKPGKLGGQTSVLVHWVK
jgi:hypothetical protein